MATLRYIAYLANDPEKVVDFYHRFLARKSSADRPKVISPSPTATII